MSGDPQRRPSGKISITGGSTVASIDTLGAYVRELHVAGAPVTKQSSDGVQTHGGAAVLMPYAGRIRRGRYSFEKKEFQLPTRKDGHAIHGFAKDAIWEVTALTEASVSMEATLKGEGYPGILRASITYSVGGRTFSTDCKVVNVGEVDAPFVVGFHPYFAADAWSIRAGSASYRYQLADAYFPTGRRVRYSFAAAGPEARLDDCFYASGSLKLLTGGKEVTMRRRKLPYIVVYNGEYAEGRSVAIEPYSGLPDAYNNGIGLSVLKPGAAFSCGYDIAVS